jgi:hypothetical protein
MITIDCMEITMNDQYEHWLLKQIHITNFVQIKDLRARKRKYSKFSYKKKHSFFLLPE